LNPNTLLPRSKSSCKHWYFIFLRHSLADPYPRSSRSLECQHHRHTSVVSSDISLDFCCKQEGSIDSQIRAE
jgi:hypothetical protein